MSVELLGRIPKNSLPVWGKQSNFRFTVCTYCSRPVKDSIIPDVWRPYSIDEVIRVVSALAKMGVKRFCLTGEEVVGITRPEDSTTPERAQRFLELTKRIRELKMQFAASLRVQSIIALGVGGMRFAREIRFLLRKQIILFLRQLIWLINGLPLTANISKN